ncbi:MAG: redoxin domain-containing protein [Planctomycetota bacterium]|nr:redoxin domain-containing protein [Planctomycetota bacterium]
MKASRVLLLLSLALAACQTVAAQEPIEPPSDAPQGQQSFPTPPGSPPLPFRPYALMVGDPAPKIEFRDWILGDPITSFEKGKVYVVALWETQVDSAGPHLEQLTRLQNQYADQGLVCIGVSVNGPKNTSERIHRFVFNEGRKIGVHIAIDPLRVSHDFWLYPTGRTTIPVTFIINREGRVAFIGQMPEFDAPFREIIDDVQDLRAAAIHYYESILSGWGYANFLDQLNRKLYVEAYNKARSISDGIGFNHWAVQSNIAWTIVDPRATPEKQDLELALRAATRASELTGDKEPETLDTLARVHFVRGEIDRAIEVQTRAVAVAYSAPQRARLQRTLDEYQKAIAAPAAPQAPVTDPARQAPAPN